MSFFDEGDEPRTAIRTPDSPQRRAPRRRGGGVDDRTLLVRRGAAALVILLVLVLIVLGIKALLDKQATQALRDYASQVNTLVNHERDEVRTPFFQQLDFAYNAANPSEVPVNIRQVVQQEETNYRTAQGWSVPSEMVGAQRQFVQALGFRYEALTKIDAQIGAALGTADQAKAITAIAGDMEMLLTSDVIYATHVKPLIAEALANAGIAPIAISASHLLPDVGWLTPQIAATRILGFVPEQLGGAPQTGSNGHQLLGVSVGSTPLSSSTSAINRFTIGAKGVTFDLLVKNSGDHDVHSVITKVLFHSASVDVSCLATQDSIPLTSPGKTYDSLIVVNPNSTCNPYGVPLRMTAEVVPVPGETDKTNNVQHYLVEFSR